MKVALSWFYILFVALVSAGLLTHNDLQSPHRTRSGSRGHAPQTTGHNSSSGASKGCCLSQGRTRPLFARREQYERQRIRVPKPKEVPVAPNDLPPPSKVAPKPVKPNCSPLTQTCVPQSGCCDPVASCHCRFFNAICFCRRTNSLSIKKP